MDSCLFCKIVRGEIPSYKVYEDELVLAILDVYPSSRGHTLIMPKEHFSDITTCPKNILDHCIEVTQLICQAQISQLNATGVNIISNCREGAGQTVMHFHIHAIPRYEHDGLSLSFPPKEIEDKELLKLCSSIKKGM